MEVFWLTAHYFGESVNCLTDWIGQRIFQTRHNPGKFPQLRILACVVSTSNNSDFTVCIKLTFTLLRSRQF